MLQERLEHARSSGAGGRCRERASHQRLEKLAHGDGVQASGRDHGRGLLAHGENEAIPAEPVQHSLDIELRGAEFFGEIRAGSRGLPVQEAAGDAQVDLQTEQERLGRAHLLAPFSRPAPSAVLVHVGDFQAREHDRPGYVQPDQEDRNRREGPVDQRKPYDVGHPEEEDPPRYLPQHRADGRPEQGAAGLNARRGDEADHEKQGGKDEQRREQPQQHRHGPLQPSEAGTGQERAHHTAQVQTDGEQKAPHDQHREIGPELSQGVLASSASPHGVEAALDRVQQEDRGQQKEQQPDHSEGPGVLHEAPDVQHDLFSARRNELADQEGLKAFDQVREAAQGGEQREEQCGQRHQGHEAGEGQPGGPDQALVLVEFPEQPSHKDRGVQPAAIV